MVVYPWIEKLIMWVFDGGAGLAAYAIIGAIPQLEVLKDDYKRYAALAIAGVFALAAYMLGVATGLMPMPIGFWGWIDALLGNVGPVLLVSQGIHGARVLAKRRQESAPVS